MTVNNNSTGYFRSAAGAVVFFAVCAVGYVPLLRLMVSIGEALQ